MQIILLERIVSLGQMGEEVRVRDGYARNFLLPQGKALRANEANRKHFEAQRAQLEARNLERRSEAEAVATKLNGESYLLVRQAAETGQLYGSVTPRDLAEAITEAGFSVTRAQVELAHPIKTIGLHDVTVRLHADVTATIVANIARSADEAERQARGEDLTNGAPDMDDEPEADVEATAEGDDTEAEPNDESDVSEPEDESESPDDASDERNS